MLGLRGRGEFRVIALVTAVQVVLVSGCGLFRGSSALIPVKTAEELRAAAAQASAAEQSAIQETKPGRTPLATGPIPVAPGKAPPIGIAEPQEGKEVYLIGEEDELEVSVYGDSDLVKTQTVRPDGQIAFPLIGDIKAAGLTPNELRADIERSISKYVRNPRVTVLVKKYFSRKVSVLGEVKTPGVFMVGSETSVIEALSRAGGLSLNADLQGATLVRDGQILPVDFDKLLRLGDVTQNVVLKPNDLILIPDVRDKKVFVVGQVKTPGVVPLKPGVTLIEAISRAEGITENADLSGAVLVRDGQILPIDFDKLLRQADVGQNVVLKPNDVVLIPDGRNRKVLVLGEVTRPTAVALKPGLGLLELVATAGGFTLDAKRSNVLIVRGGFGDPTLITVNVDKLTEGGDTVQNVRLETGDIVYVPRTLVADVVRFFQNLTSILTPMILAMSGIVLGPQVMAVFSGKATSSSVPTAVPIGR